MYDTSSDIQAYDMKAKDELTVTVRRTSNQFVNMVKGLFKVDIKGSKVGSCTREVGNSNQ